MFNRLLRKEKHHVSLEPYRRTSFRDLRQSPCCCTWHSVQPDFLSLTPSSQQLKNSDHLDQIPDYRIMKSLRLPSRGFFIFPTTPNLSKLCIGDLPINCITTGEASLVISARQRGGRNAPVSCRAYWRPPLCSWLGYHSPSVLSRALLSATSAWQSPMTAPPPCGTGQTTGQRGAAALRPARRILV